MSTSQAGVPRFVLVAPEDAEPQGFAPRLAEALEAGDVAAVLIGGRTEAQAEAFADALVPVAQAHGAAALILDHSRVAGRTRADGLHIEADRGGIADAVGRWKPAGIVGAGGLLTRHAAMEAAEAVPRRRDGPGHEHVRLRGV